VKFIITVLRIFPFTKELPTKIHKLLHNFFHQLFLYITSALSVNFNHQPGNHSKPDVEHHRWPNVIFNLCISHKQCNVMSISTPVQSDHISLFLNQPAKNSTSVLSFSYHTIKTIGFLNRFKIDHYSF
jgi:hypothetical protein